MTKEQSEAIEYLEKQINYFKEQIKFIEAVDCDYYDEEYELYKNRIKQFETVLNMLKEKDAEIEKYKNLLASNLAKNLNDSIKAKEKANTDLDDLDKGWKVELEKKDKIIDLILDKLNQGRNIFENSEIKEILEIYEVIKSTSDLRGIELRKSCLKQYFERKATNDG